jgi:hypothetical protein
MRYTISLDLSEVVAAGQAVLNGVLPPAIKEAVGGVATAVAADWKASVLAAGGKGGLYASERDAYAESVAWKFTSDASAVVSSDYKEAAAIEAGRPARDLKLMLNTSLKTRVSDKGKRYLIIPLRHNVSSMPAAVHAEAKGMTASSITGRHTLRNQLGVQSVKNRQTLGVERNTYAWGGRLSAGMGEKGAGHATDKFAGMVKMNTSSGKAKSSAYLTFRVMSEGATGWIIPARPGLNIVSGVVERASGAVERIAWQAVSGALPRS